MKKAQYIDDERAIGNGIFVYLRYGFRFSEDMLVPSHVLSFDTMTEARQAIKNAIPCDCSECQKHKKEKPFPKP